MLKAAAGAQREREKEPRTEGYWGRSHDLETVGHMTMTCPSHQPLLPSTQAPPWAQELPRTAVVTGTVLHDLGSHHRLPRTFLQVSPQPLPTSQLPLQPHVALVGFLG